MIRPNFLIVGAAKSGTTSAYEYLRAHPEVFMPERKEPTFFACPEAGGITDETEYWRLFEKARGKKAIGEASVAYLYDPDSPKRISAALGPEVKIVVFLRNPVDTSYSLWGHEVREGIETLSFEEALAKESERISDPAFARSCRGWVGNLAYTARARYAEQLERYYQMFPPGNIKVFIFEEFFVPGLPLYQKLCRFLGVNERHTPDGRAHNAAGTVRSTWLRRICSERMAWKEPFKLLLPEAMRKSIISDVQRYNRKEQPLPKLDPEVRRMLGKRFEDDVERLEKLIDRKLRDLWFPLFATLVFLPTL